MPPQVVLLIICGIIAQKKATKKAQATAKANPPQVWNPKAPAPASTAWSPPTTAPPVVTTGGTTEKAGVTDSKFGTGNQATYTGPATGNDTEIVAIMVYPSNTYNPSNTYTPYAIYSAPAGNPTSSPPAPPIKPPPSY
jgi:hypothetical protein